MRDDGVRDSVTPLSKRERVFRLEERELELRLLGEHWARGSVLLLPQRKSRPPNILLLPPPPLSLSISFLLHTRFFRFWLLLLLVLHYKQNLLSFNLYSFRLQLVSFVVLIFFGSASDGRRSIRPRRHIRAGTMASSVGNTRSHCDHTTGKAFL